MALFGFLVGILNSGLGVAVQQVVPPHMLGRVGGALNGMVTAANPVGYLLAGLAAKDVSLPTVFLARGWWASKPRLPTRRFRGED